MTLEPGTRIGPYEVTGSLGAGGMGEVYRATDTKLGRDVAIKVLSKAFTADPDRLARFEREARLLASLNHPNVAAIYGLEETMDAGTALVLELVEGPTLADRILDGAIPTDEVLLIARQLVLALAAAHQAGIVHRDLKPANIKVRTDGTVKVLDFGLAKGLVQEGGTDLSKAETISVDGTVAGTLLGTPAYMSPEQVRGQDVDTRSDVWAFGCVLYEMLTGGSPFGRGTLFDTIAAVLERPVDWQLLPSSTPAGMAAVVRRCLEREIGQRLSTIAEAGRLLVGADTATASAVRPQTPSIAVLPFANTSADPEQHYFCEGLADELIDALVRVDGLRVVARTSSFKFASRDSDIGEIGRTLNVQTVLEGSVRRAGSRVRITAQLVKVSDGFHVWSERYDRTLDDIFAVQDEIARAVVGKLRVALLGSTDSTMVTRPTQSLEAYTAYMQGRQYRHGRANPIRAIECFEEAVRYDPNYAAAWAALADVAVMRGVYVMEHVDETLTKARAAVDRALSLDDSLAEAHAASGLIRFYLDWDWPDAERRLLRATKLNPASVDAKIGYAYPLGYSGRTDEALAQIALAREVDPLSARALEMQGAALCIGRQYKAAADACHEALELQPDHSAALWWLSLIYQVSSRHDESIAIMERVSEAAKRFPMHQCVLGNSLGRAHREKEAREVLAGLVERQREEYIAPPALAFVHLGLGEIDECIDLLWKGYEQRAAMLVLLQNPAWDEVRDHPRGQELLSRLGFPDPRRTEG